MGAGARPLAVVHDEGRGPAVVLLHGQPGTAAEWRGVLARLPPTVRAIVPDRPGYGRTGGKASGFAGNALAVLDLLDALDVERAHVVGYSWSGGVALALARAAPGRLSSLTFVSSVRPGGTLGPVDRALALPGIGPLAAAVMGLAGRLLLVSPVRRAIDRRYRGVTEEALTAMGQALAGGRTRRSFFVEQRALFDELPGLAGVAESIAVPAAVLFGSQDRVISAASGEALARSIPGARSVRVEGAGHLLPLEHPDAVAAAVLENVFAGGAPAG